EQALRRSRGAGRARRVPVRTGRPLDHRHSAAGRRRLDRALRSLAMHEASNRPHVVIVGAGFGGLAAAKRLANCAVDVTIVDQRNHHVFQPLLYQVATAALSPADIAGPIRSIFSRARNIRVILDSVTGVDAIRNGVRLASGGELRYDWLILATGARHSYFGHEEWSAHAP